MGYMTLGKSFSLPKPPARTWNPSDTYAVICEGWAIPAWGSELRDAGERAVGFCAVNGVIFQ